MKLGEKIALAVVGAIVLIAGAGFIKFNFIDVPYLGTPVTYVSKTGEIIEVHSKVDDFIEVRFTKDSKVENYFTAKRLQSASGVKYQSTDGAFVFWEKGPMASVFQEDELIYTGVKKE